MPLTGSAIGAPRYSVVNFDNAFRGGVAISSGYDWVLGDSGKWGLSVYGKYHIVNAFFHANGLNGEAHINDGNGSPGSGYDRYMGLLSINVAINMYGGVKSLTSLMK